MIRKWIIVFAFLFLSTRGFYSQEPTISIAFDTDHFLFGQPVRVTYAITNLSKAYIWIGGKEENGQFRLLERDSKAFYPNGKEVPQHRGGAMTVGTRPTPKKKLICGDSVIWSQIVPVTDVSIDNLPSGKYNLIFYLKYSLKEETGAFEKKAEASTTFYVDTPEREDAAWLLYVANVKRTLFKDNPNKISLSHPLIWGDVINCGFCPHGFRDIRSELLQKFPTSTYAAYAACPPNQWTSNTDPERILKSIETGTYLSNGSVPDDTGKSKDGWLYLGGRDLIDWRAKWIGIVLKNHPDIWYADHLKLRLAVDQVALKNYQAGESDLEKLSKDAMPEVAEKAKAYLSLMKQKGWVAAPIEKSVPEAVVVK